MRLPTTDRCRTVRSWVSAAHDDELSVERQVALHSHLALCTACRHEQDELVSLGVALRRGAAERRPDDTAFTGLATEVLARTPFEQCANWRRRVREVVREGPGLWIVGGALAATMAVTVLLSTALRLSLPAPVPPPSLAGVLQASTTLGTNANPIWLISGVSLRLVSPDAQAATMLTQPWSPLGRDNLALAGVVTREGQLASVKILRTAPDADLARAVSRLASSVSFVPTLADGTTVAVNFVWLLERMIVRGET